MPTTSRILVVDDDPSILELTTAVLTDEGYDVVAAAGGARALEIATASPVDLVLLDMRMPDVSGWDVARELQHQKTCPPIIVITASLDAARTAREVGAASYIEKPFAISDLLRVVARTRLANHRNNQTVTPPTH
jgi:DNA-binding response OmpR family regulator